MIIEGRIFIYSCSQTLSISKEINDARHDILIVPPPIVDAGYATGKLGNIILPINVFLFAHLGKHCCGNKVCFPGSKKIPKKFRNIFLRKQCLLVCPHACFQMFPARETLFSRLGMLKHCLKTIVQT